MNFYTKSKVKKLQTCAITVFSVLLFFMAAAYGDSNRFFKVATSVDCAHSFFAPDGTQLFLSSVEHLYRQYKEQHKSVTWAGDVLGDIDSAGFNSLGAGPDSRLRVRRPYTLIAWIAESMTTSNDADDYISATKHHAPCTGFPNVFSSKWPERAREWAKRVCAPEKDDPYLVGWYLDNELKWWGSGSYGNGGTGLYDAVAGLPPGHSARRSLEAFVAGFGSSVTGAPDRVRRAFVEDAARRFFREACAAVREADPNHLILGVRFAGLDAAPDSAWRMCGEYCDVVSFNIYPWVDFNDLTFSTSSPGFGGRDLRSVAEMRHRQAGRRPMIVSEWGFSALDSGLSCLKGAGQRFYTQCERAAAVELTLREFVSWPFLVGCSWFRYMDMAPEEGDGEDCNYGLVARNRRSYREVAEVFRRIHGELAELRKGPRRHKPSRPQCARAAMTAGYATCRFAPLSPDTGFSFRASSGSPASLVFDGTDCGTFGPMVSCLDAKGRERWFSSTVASGAGTALDGSWMLTNRISCGHTELRTVVRLVFSAGGRMAAELKEIENVGSKKAVLRKFYFRNEPPFVRSATVANEPLDKRLLWGAISASAWISQDGFYIGALSVAPFAQSFGYSVRNNGASVHPDAAFCFSQSGDLTLVPRAVWNPDGRIWAVFAAGRGGMQAWNEVRNGFCRAVRTDK